MSTRALVTILVAVASCAAGCGAPVVPPESAPDEPEGRTTPRDDLRWKRGRAIERDLARGLALREDELCLELGAHRCLRAQDAEHWSIPDTGGFDGYFDLIVPGGLHLVSLGGNDPYFANQHSPIARPLATSVAALDRVAISACARRIELDSALPRSERVVFGDLDISTSAPLSPSSPGLSEQTTSLYRRLLARDPTPDELGAHAALAGDGASPITAAELALASCFAISTSAEFVYQ